MAGPVCGAVSCPAGAGRALLPVHAPSYPLYCLQSCMVSQETLHIDIYSTT